MAVVKFLHASISVSIGINYINNLAKTDETLVSGKDCMAESAQEEMQFVQANYTGTGKRSYYHMIQSFSPDDKVTPELAHEIGLQMAKHCYPGHQVLVATHLDKKHIHNHFIINAVNFETNKMLNMSYQRGLSIKQYSNELCQKYGLSTTEVKSQRKDMPEWKRRLRYSLADAMANSENMEEYIQLLRNKGIRVNYDKTHKHMTYTDRAGHKCRDNKLFDERFLKENLEMYFDLGGCYSLTADDICDYETPKTGNCTTGLATNILEMIASLPNTPISF